MTFRGVIFDLDGTLLDTLDDIADSVNAVLAAAGLPQHPTADYPAMIGEGVEMLLRRALPQEKRSAEEVAEFVRRMRGEYGRRCLRKTKPYPGMRELLARLTGRGMKLAVLSNKADDLTRQIVDGVFGEGLFALVRGSRPDVPRKPDPKAALEIAKALALAPEEILFLGDTSIDMHTARAAKMVPVGVLWGFRSEAELREAGAQALLKRPLDLLEGPIGSQV